MRLLVCVKLVSQSQYTDFFQEEAESRLSSGRLTINPADEYALELALRLRASQRDSRVTLLTLAPATARHMLQTGLAMGADEAVHVCDPCFSGSDTLATSRALAAAIRAISFRGMILCGQKAIDSETGHIGPQLSVHLGIPVISNVTALQTAGTNLQVEQLRDEGTVSLLCSEPTIFTVCRGTQMIRRPTIAGLREAAGKPIRTLTCQNLGLSPQEVGGAGSPTKVVATSRIIHHRRSGAVCFGAEAGTQLLLQLISKKGVS